MQEAEAKAFDKATESTLERIVVNRPSSWVLALPLSYQRGPVVHSTTREAHRLAHIPYGVVQHCLGRDLGQRTVCPEGSLRYDRAGAAQSSGISDDPSQRDGNGIRTGVGRTRRTSSTDIPASS